MEDLRRVTELLGRGIAGRARVGGFRDVRTGTRRKAGDVGGRGGPARTVTRYFPRPEVVGIAQAADGSVELAIECPKLERDRKLYLEVRRRAGQSGEYRAIGRTRDTRFVDPAPYEGGATAAYKVVARRGMRSGPHSRRAQVVLSSASIREARAALRQARSAGGDRVLAAAA
jgi:hypothetical protein